jgi:hypothetical protein
MHVLSSPIQYIKLRRVHKKQKRIALHMLAVSGVVRPSHIQLRYAAPIVNSASPSCGQEATTGHFLTYPVPLQSWDHDVTPNIYQPRQWGRSLSSAIVQLARQPILFRWARQLEL